MTFIKICVVLAFIAIASATPTKKTESKLDDIEINNYVEIKRNDYQSNEIKGRSEDSLEEYMRSHDFTFKFPIIGSTVTFGARNLDNGEIDVKLNYNSGTGVEARKSKLKKLFIPIFVFILIKAIILIPLALGVLAIKTWNALQLSFVSFVVAIALGVWQLCKKIVGDSAHPQIIAHNPWEADYKQYAARSLGEDAQKLAYSAYQQ